MSDFNTTDYFTDPELIDDPFPYFEHLRGKCPVQQLPHRNAVAVTGYAEGLEVYRDPTTFSSVNVTGGPLTVLGFEPKGEDITEQIEQHRSRIPLSDRLVSLDAPQHSPLRSLLTPLFTPSRLKEIETKLWTIADKLIDRFAPSGRLEVISQYGKPFSGMAIVELLGVPEEDLPWFDDKFSGHLPKFDEKGVDHDLFHAVAPKFVEYTVDRRANPRPDVLSELAATRFPDGTLPSVDQVAMLASFLFTAGQDTTARLLGTAMQVIAEQPELQQKLRADRRLIPDFVEEALRFDGPTKTSNRLVRKATCLGGVQLQAGTTVSLMNGAMNRDPRRFESPGEFRLGRPRAKEHLAFGRGPHTCIGSPLARVETVVSMNRLLDRLGNIRIDEEKHGPPRPRRFRHEQTYILRGHVALHVTFEPLKPNGN